MPDRQSWDDNLRDVLIIFIKALKVPLGIVIVGSFVLYVINAVGPDLLPSLVESVRGLLGTNQ